MDEKFFFCDLETTGTDSAVNGIHQISIHIFANGKTEHAGWKVQPFSSEIIEDEALKVSGITRETLTAYRDPRIVYHELIKLLSNYVDKYNRADKFFFVAYNAPFDMDFMRSFFKKNGDEYFGSWFYYPDWCVMRQALTQLYKNRSGMKNFQLSTLMSFNESAGSDKITEGFHDADVDIKATLRLFRFLNPHIQLAAI